jgi:hypothetical protein
MIKRIASCPYCRRGEIALDCETMDVILNPDGGSQEPCEHLVCLQGFCCRAGLMRDGRRQTGFAQLHWHHPELRSIPPQEIYRQLQQWTDAAQGEPPCRVDSVGWTLTESLSQAEVARWLDEVGWDRAEQAECPFLECQLEGWVAFARRPTDLFTLRQAG